MQRLGAAVEGFLLSVSFLYLDVHLNSFNYHVYVFRASLLVSYVGLLFFYLTELPGRTSLTSVSLGIRM